MGSHNQVVVVAAVVVVVSERQPQNPISNKKTMTIKVK
jgi:hypothetical protein